MIVVSFSMTCPPPGIALEEWEDLSIDVFDRLVTWFGERSEVRGDVVMDDAFRIELHVNPDSHDPSPVRLAELWPLLGSVAASGALPLTLVRRVDFRLDGLNATSRIWQPDELITRPLRGEEAARTLVCCAAAARTPGASGEITWSTERHPAIAPLSVSDPQLAAGWRNERDERLLGGYLTDTPWTTFELAHTVQYAWKHLAPITTDRDRWITITRPTAPAPPQDDH